MSSPTDGIRQLWSLSLEIRHAFGPYLIWFTFTVIAMLWWLATLRLDGPEREDRELSAGYGALEEGMGSGIKPSASEATLLGDEPVKWVSLDSE